MEESVQKKKEIGQTLFKHEPIFFDFTLINKTLFNFARGMVIVKT